jgi:hypothetical protein
MLISEQSVGICARAVSVCCAHFAQVTAMRNIEIKIKISQLILLTIILEK